MQCDELGRRCGTQSSKYRHLAQEQRDARVTVGQLSNPEHRRASVRDISWVPIDVFVAKIVVIPDWHEFYDSFGDIVGESWRAHEIIPVTKIFYQAIANHRYERSDTEVSYEIPHSISSDEVHIF